MAMDGPMDAHLWPMHGSSMGHRCPLSFLAMAIDGPSMAIDGIENPMDARKRVETPRTRVKSFEMI